MASITQGADVISRCRERVVEGRRIVAGESAQREYERVRDARRQRIRSRRAILPGFGALLIVGGAAAAHFVLGVWWLGALLGLIAVGSILAPSQREVAWRKGAEGEQAVGRALDALGPHTRALHDRRIAGSRANIDHILVAPTGVWTIDAKNYTGKIERRRRGQELWINGRDRSKLLEQARRQATVVRSTLAEAELGSIPVAPALCFLGVEWPLLFTPQTARDVRLISPWRLSKLASGEPTLSANQVEQVGQALERGLQPATEPRRNRPAPQSMGTPPTARSGRADREPTRPGQVVVKSWKRYGKHRLYVNHADGSTLGCVDLESNDVVPIDEHHKEVVAQAVARHLRDG